MEWEETGIEGSWIITPKVHEDERGTFQEIFKLEGFEENVGHSFVLAQANMSVSKAGVIRGVHYASIPPSQAKYVKCVRGSMIDVIVDIRLGSPTFGKAVMVPLNSDEPRFVYLSEGLGHAFISLEDDTAVSYMVSETYNPDREFAVHPFDKALGIEWPRVGADGQPLTWEVSAKDMGAPSLAQAVERGALPTYDEAVEYRKALKG